MKETNQQVLAKLSSCFGSSLLSHSHSSNSPNQWHVLKYTESFCWVKPFVEIVGHEEGLGMPERRMAKSTTTSLISSIRIPMTRCLEGKHYLLHKMSRNFCCSLGTREYPSGAKTAYFKFRYFFEAKHLLQTKAPISHSRDGMFWTCQGGT